MPLTVSEAIDILERAFRAKNPNEIERVLRENLNVQVAIIGSKENAENKINKGYYPITVRVPYGIFKSKAKDKKIYSCEQETIISEENKRWKLQEVSINEVLPFNTYFLLRDEAGYHPELGLTFKGEGEVTGFEEIKKGEKSEKFGEGREQTWEEHAIGSYRKAEQILELYKAFLVDWAKSVFSVQNLSDEEINETIDAMIVAIKISVLLHDVGKLRKGWQEAVGWEKGKSYIARTSQRHKVPFHAPYAYPFLKTLLRGIFGEYRFLDTIALAVARHHSLEVTGAIKENDFELADENVVKSILNILSENIPELKTHDKKELEKKIQGSVKATNEGSFMDEPPNPSDDFYFLYTITNRVVKLADWEDAGDEIIELPEIRVKGDVP